MWSGRERSAIKQEFTELLLRVEQMERCLDAVEVAVALRGRAALEDTAIREQVQILEEYQDSGLWLQDYEADERGELPDGLKRGVLAQDTLYDLLCSLRQSEEG